jgi:hypothetical protein
MELAPSHRNAQDYMGINPGYYYIDHNVPIPNNNTARFDPRGYPLNGSVGGGPRFRGALGRDDNSVEAGQARRRIAVACARCRKRKIRCSGDPGNGAGCTHCKAAGILPSACQFHRVGSDHVGRVLDSISLANSLTNLATAHSMIPIYNHGTPLYSRTGHNSYPQLDTKSVYPPSWTIPYPEETSPVETYSMDQPAAYMPTQGAMAAADTYGSNHRANQGDSKTFPSGSATYLDHEHSSFVPFCNTGLSYQQSNGRGAAAEAFSPLNMTALQLNLPGATSIRQAIASEQTGPQRQLPIPLPSPAQTSRNVVDQLQDQRLRSAQAIGRTPSMNRAAFTNTKLDLSFKSECDVQATTTTDASAADLAQMAAPPLLTTSDAPLNFIPVTTSASEMSTSGSTPTSLNFSTSTLLKSMPAPALPTPSYSNFRDYNLPMSCSTESLSYLARHDSQTNLYSFSPEGKRSSATTNDDALVNGQRYTPLGHKQPQHQASLEDIQREAAGTRGLRTH